MSNDFAGPARGVTPGLPTNTGSFKATERDEAGVSLSPVEQVPPPPLTPRDVEILAENKGCFVNGYDPHDADKVLSRFESAIVSVYWGYHDDNGLGGDSFFAGYAAGSRATGTYGEGRAVPAARGPERLFSDEAWEFLSDPDSDIDPERIPSLLAEPANIDKTELHTFSIGMGEQFAFADETLRTCNFCSVEYHPNDNGGYEHDGYCFDHCLLIDEHRDGDHEGVSDIRLDDCPECQHHGEKTVEGLDEDNPLNARPVCEICQDPTTEKDSHGTLVCLNCQDEAGESGDSDDPDDSESLFAFQVPGSSADFEVRVLDDEDDEDSEPEYELWRDGTYLGSFAYLGDPEDHESIQEAAQATRDASR